MPDLFLRHNFATTTTINTRLCVPHSARHTLYTHRPNAWSWQPRIPRHSLGNTRHPDGHKNTEKVIITVLAISLQPRRLSTRGFVCRAQQGTHYTHIVQKHGHDSQEFRDIHLVILVTLMDTNSRKCAHHGSRHFSATTTTINTRLCVPRCTRHTLYTHRPNAWSWQQRISRYSHTEKSLDYEVSYLCYYYWSLVLVLRAIYLCHVNDS